MDEITLIKWSGNWADEMDLEGFCLVTPAEADDIWTRLTGVTEEITSYLGTNEELEWNNGPELLKELTRIDLTMDEAIVLKKAIGHSYFGKFPDVIFEAGLYND